MVEEHSQENDRRRLLSALGTGVTGLLAGCMGGGNSGGQPSDDDNRANNPEPGDSTDNGSGGSSPGNGRDNNTELGSNGDSQPGNHNGSNDSENGEPEEKNSDSGKEKNDPIFDENLIERIHEESLDRRESAMKLLPAHDDWGGVLFGDYGTLHSLLTETYGNIEYDVEQYGADSEWFLNVVTDTDGTSLTSDYLNAKFVGVRNPEGNPLIDNDKYEVSRQVRIEGESLDLFRRDDWPNWTIEGLYLDDENLLAIVESDDSIDEYRSDMAKILNGDVTTVWDEDFGNSFYNSELTDLDNLIIAAAYGEDIRYIGESNITDVTDRHDNEYSNIHVYSAELQEGTRPKILEEVIDPTNQYKPVIGPNERELNTMAFPFEVSGVDDR